MSNGITGVVTNGVIVPSAPLPEGARVRIELHAGAESAVLRGVPASQVRGIAAGVGAPPDDKTVRQWIEEGRLEKYR